MKNIFEMFDGSEDNLKNAAIKNRKQQESRETEDQKELDVSKNRVDTGK
ncbi:MAG: hypothetical protein ABFD18_19420 [Syntrophomonas sp.]